MAFDSRWAVLVLVASGGLVYRAAVRAEVQRAEPVIRISSDLVQVDAVVTDSKGGHVLGLRPEDFGIREDGKRQPITHFSYVSATPPAGRTIVFLVDNCDTPPLFLSSALPAPLDAVLTGIRPEDRVSLLATADGSGYQGRLTGEAGLLSEGLQHFLGSRVRGRSSCGDQAEGRHETAVVEGLRPAKIGAGQPFFRGISTLDGLRAAVNGLADLPGRKSIVVISQFMGWVVFPEKSPEIRELADRANRAGVAIYVLDPIPVEFPRGLPTPAAEGQYRRQGGADYLARATGGLAVRDRFDLLLDDAPVRSRQRRNDAAASAPLVKQGLKAIVDDIGDYYLIGYKPPVREKAKKGGVTLRKVQVSVRRRGLTVRSRNGYYDGPERLLPAAPRTPEEQLRAAVRSPFLGGDMRVQVTPFYSAREKNAATGRWRPLIRAMLAIDARDLNFQEQTDGIWKAVVDVEAATYGTRPEPAAEGSTTCELSVPPGGPGDVGAHSMLCSVEMNLDEPGAYMVRVAARDRASGKIGSACSLAPVSNFNGAGPTLSSVMLASLPRERVESEVGYESVESTVSFETPPDPGHATTAPPERFTAGPRFALTGDNEVDRVFRPGRMLVFACELFVPRSDGPGVKQDLVASVLLIRVANATQSYGSHFRFPQMPIRVEDASWPVAIRGKLWLSPNTPPGLYAVHIEVRDKSLPLGGVITHEGMIFTVAAR